MNKGFVEFSSTQFPRDVIIPTIDVNVPKPVLGDWGIIKELKKQELVYYI